MAQLLRPPRVRGDGAHSWLSGTSAPLCLCAPSGPHSSLVCFSLCGARWGWSQVHMDWLHVDSAAARETACDVPPSETSPFAPWLERPESLSPLEVRTLKSQRHANEAKPDATRLAFGGKWVLKTGYQMFSEMRLGRFLASLEVHGSVMAQLRANDQVGAGARVTPP